MMGRKNGEMGKSKASELFYWCFVVVAAHTNQNRGFGLHSHGVLPETSRHSCLLRRDRGIAT